MELVIDGRGYPLPATGDLTFDEWRFLKARTGLTAAAFEAAMRATDPDAWYGLCLVALRRVDGDAADEEALGAVNFSAVLTAIAAPDAAEGDAGPPDPDGPTGNGHADNSSVSPSPEPTPAEPGVST